MVLRGAARFGVLGIPGLMDQTLPLKTKRLREHTWVLQNCLAGIENRTTRALPDPNIRYTTETIAGSGHRLSKLTQGKHVIWSEIFRKSLYYMTQ